MEKLSMEKIVNISKQYGFIFQGSEIYDGLANTWDYGPLGSRIKNAIKESNKASVIVYFILRFLVIVCLIRELCYGNLENALICILALILFLVPAFLEKTLKIDFSLHEDFSEMETFIKKINPKHVVMVHCSKTHSDQDDTIEQKLMRDSECQTQFTFAEENEIYKL